MDSKRFIEEGVIGMKATIGDKIVALNSNKACGYRKGDEIIVVKKSTFDGDFTGKNLSRPDCYGSRSVYIGCHIKYRVINDNQIINSFQLFGKWLITIRRMNKK